MAHTHHKKPNFEMTDVNVPGVVSFGLVLGLLVVAAFAITVYLFEFLANFEKSRKISEYPMVANEIKNEEIRVRNSVLEDAQNDALLRRKKGNLISARTPESLKEREEVLLSDKVYQEKRAEIEAIFQARQDNRIFTIGFMRPALPGPGYGKMDQELLAQGIQKDASSAADKNGTKGRIVISRLEGIDPLRPMMSGVPGWPTYAHVSAAVSEDVLKNHNLQAGIKAFVSKYQEKNKEANEKSKALQVGTRDFMPSDSSAGTKAQGNNR